MHQTIVPPFGGIKDGDYCSHRANHGKAEASFSTPNAGATTDAARFRGAHGVLRLAGAFGRDQNCDHCNAHECFFEFIAALSSPKRKQASALQTLARPPTLPDF